MVNNQKSGIRSVRKHIDQILYEDRQNSSSMDAIGPIKASRWGHRFAQLLTFYGCRKGSKRVPVRYVFVYPVRSLDGRKTRECIEHSLWYLDSQCVKSGVREGPLTQHTPLWDGCPHHAEWKAKQSKRKKTQRVKGKGGPSKDRPCKICGSDSHWANKCPQKGSDKDKKKDEEEVQDAGTDMAAIATCVAEAVTGALTPLTQTLVQQQERIMAAIAPRNPPQRQLANAPWGGSEYGGSQGSGYFRPGPNSPSEAQG